MLKIIPPYIKYITKVYLSVILIFTLFRIILFALALAKWGTTTDQNIGYIFKAFLIGFRFDSVVAGYILFFPFLVMGIFSFFDKTSKILAYSVSYYLVVLIAIAFLICCIDIPYFFHFFSRFSVSGLMWMKYGTYSVRMILGESSFYIYFLLFFLLIIPMIFGLRRFRIEFLSTIEKSKGIYINIRQKYFRFLLFLLTAFLLFAAIRGRVGIKSSIRPGTSFFCNDPLLNILGLNPVFSFGRSFEVSLQEKNQKVKFMNPKDAFKNVHSFLNISTNNDTFFSISRDIQFGKDTVLKPNVFIVIMESMSMFKLGLYNGPKGLTPNLNGLISTSYFFDHFFAAGNHTFNGLYSTLFSYPALNTQQPMEIYYDIPHKGIANILKENGYKTCFFTTQDAQFDNMEGFLHANGFDTIVSEPDYPKEWIVNVNGVPDHKMFEYSIPVIEKLSKKTKPLFCVFLTASDHAPYILPDKKIFHPKSDKIDYKMVEYADWSIGQFMKNISKESFYKNSIFIFTADHGINMGHTYDLPLSCQHIPLIIHSPLLIKSPNVFHNFGGQIDIVPTLLGLLKMPYQNNTQGIDLLQDKRQFMYFCADNKIGCIDEKHYLILRNDNIETLYQYDNLETKNYIKDFPAKVDSMKKYTYSMMQVTQWIIDNRKLK